MSDEGIEDFVGFYDGEGFWVESHIDVDCPEGRRALAGIMPAPAVWYQAEKFSAIVCIDGLMLLHVNHLARTRPNMGDPDKMNEAVAWWDEHMDYANVMQLYIASESIRCPDSGEVSFSAVSMANTCRVGVKNGVPVRKNHTNRMSLMTARIASLAVQQIDETHHMIGTWSAYAKVKKQAILKALERFDLAVNDPVFIKRLGFIARAKTSYRDHDFRGAFIMIWFVIESIIKEMWLEMVWVSGPRTQPAYKMLVGLEKRSLIDTELFFAINDLRNRVRNNLAHESDTAVCMPGDCFQAAGCAIKLLGVNNPAMDLTIKWHYGVQF